MALDIVLNRYNPQPDAYDIVIVGAGPSGLSAAARAAELGLAYLLLEAEAEPASTIRKYQRGKHVMAEPRGLPLRGSLPFAPALREAVLDSWKRPSTRSGSTSDTRPRWKASAGPAKGCN